MYLRQLVLLKQSIKNKISLQNSFAVILKVHNLSIWENGTQANHVIDRCGQNVVDEYGVVILLASIKEFSDTVDRNQIMSSLSKNLWIGLVGIVIDIRFHIELIS